MKNVNIETLRGFAIIAVVLGHVIGNNSEQGMKVTDDSFWRYIYYSFEYLRMPIFTAISGWVYAHKPIVINSEFVFISKKIRRILVPLFFVGSVYYILQSIIPGTNNTNPISQFWTIIVFPYSLYWYLNSLFCIFLVLIIFEKLKLFETKKSFFILLSISTVFLLIKNSIIPAEIPNYFGFKGAIYLLPFFVLGVGVFKYQSIFENIIAKRVSAFLLIALLIFQQILWFIDTGIEINNSNILGVAIAMVGILVLLRINFTISFFKNIGFYSYSIYLFHSFGTSAPRIIFHKFEIYNSVLIFISSLFLGIVMPIIVHNIIIRNKVLKVLFLGKSYKHNEKKVRLLSLPLFSK